MPKVSVVMPVYNAEKYLVEAIDSILGQTFTDFEFIIIDDGSTDLSAEIVCNFEDARIRFYQNEHNIGVAATLNRGLGLASGKYIARMDADDISLPERFEKQVAYLETHNRVAVCASNIYLFGSVFEYRCFSKSEQQLKIDLLFSSCFAHPSVMLRASFFGKNKLRYDERYEGLEDYALWIEVAKNHELACIQEVLFKYRIHPHQITQNYYAKIHMQHRVIKRQQFEELGVLAIGADYDEFIRYCNGENSFSADSIIALASFIDKVIIANKRRNIYNQRLLEITLRTIILRKLDRHTAIQATLLVRKCGKCIGIRPFIYIAKRILLGLRSKINNYITVIKLQNKLFVRNFTILSNNCWGGFIYQKYGLKYNTPTIGLFILGDDFVKFCSNLDLYLSAELVFIPWENTRYYSKIKESKPFPIARLNHIEIYFMHYHTENEAKEKWQRRKKRINRDKLLLKLSQRQNCETEDIKNFLALPYKHKICFSYDKVEGAIHIPELKDLLGDEQILVDQYFDELEYINRL